MPQRHCSPVHSKARVDGSQSSLSISFQGASMFIHASFLVTASSPLHSALQRARWARGRSRYRPGRGSLGTCHQCNACHEGFIARCCQGNRSSNLNSSSQWCCRSYDARSDGAEDASTRQPCDPRSRSPNSSANGSSRKSTYTYISPASMASLPIRLHHVSSRCSSLAALQPFPRPS